jgi:RNA processing factor Prp31
VNISSGRNEHEDTSKANTSNNSEDEKMEDSASSHHHNKHKKKNNAKNSSAHNELKRKADSHCSTDSDEFDLLESVIKNGRNQKLIDRLLGCAYGQALGDAYGLATEFEDRERVAYNYPDASKLIPFPGYILTGHNRRWTRGDWTDDTDQWILILDTLMENDGDVKVFAKKLTNWIRRGFPELGDYGGMGLGANVSQVILFFSKAFR